jgi:electron transport complex protein RnfE
LSTKSREIFVTGPKDTDEFIKGIWAQNPVFVQVLGMCPTLAVTNSATNALAMGLATAFVLLMSNTLVSSLRHAIPKQVRIASYIAIIATFVTAVDYIIQAISLELHKSLGAYVSLIVVNCVILGRAEAFASKNNLKRSVYDALGMGLGFTLALLCLGVIRELLGSGTFFNLSIMPGNFEHWVIMLLPGGAFFVLALWMLLINRLKQTHHKSKGSTHE